MSSKRPYCRAIVSARAIESRTSLHALVSCLINTLIDRSVLDVRCPPVFFGLVASAGKERVKRLVSHKVPRLLTEVIRGEQNLKERRAAKLLTGAKPRFVDCTLYCTLYCPLMPARGRTQVAARETGEGT